LPGQANLIDLFGRHPFFKLAQSHSTIARNSGFLANSSAGFPNPLLNTAHSCCNSFASACSVNLPNQAITRLIRTVSLTPPRCKAIPETIYSN